MRVVVAADWQQQLRGRNINQETLKTITHTKADGVEDSGMGGPQELHCQTFVMVQNVVFWRSYRGLMGGGRKRWND